VTARRTLVRILRLAVVGLVTLLVVPSGGVQPAAISLYGVETANGVDLEDGQLWVLVLGADSEGRTDAIHLVGMDRATSSGVALGIPRDTWLDMPGIGFARINEAYMKGGPKATADAVAELTGITPDLVLHMDSDGFLDLMSTLGPVEVRTPQEFTNDGVHVEKGLNTFSPKQALAYVDYRVGLERGDFDRSANQQRLMEGALTSLQAQEDEVGFMERATISAIGALDTDRGPSYLYRLAQFVTTVEPKRVDTCVITGTFDTVGEGAQVVIVDPEFSRAIGSDAEDFRLQQGCPDATG
jgi:LCP family protein required for cell wall assembly